MNRVRDRNQLAQQRHSRCIFAFESCVLVFNCVGVLDPLFGGGQLPEFENFVLRWKNGEVSRPL